MEIVYYISVCELKKCGKVIKKKVFDRKEKNRGKKK